MIFPNRTLRLGLGLTLAALSAVSMAEIQYKATLRPDSTRLELEVTIPTKAGTLAISMPNWAPGAYMLSNYAKQIQGMSVVDKTGKTILPIGDTDNTWTLSNIAGGSVTVKYNVPIQNNAGAFHFAGPAAYIYVVGRKDEDCRLTMDVPTGWPVHCGLDEVKGKANTFTAPDYDVLADNPVSTGDMLIDTYMVEKKPHIVLLLGERRVDVDRKRLVDLLKHVTLAQRDFFGGLPYNKYVWHFFVSDAVDGGWGLEHLSSTQIGLASGLGPGITSVISHEFFHLWNVKRIRSKPLGPFDYNVLPKTGALWWLEGVTDYYADYLLHRYGWFQDEMFKSMLNIWQRTEANKAYKTVSPYESSMKVGDAAGGRGNSSGFEISYYDLGWLAGMCLDIEVRAQSNGKYSLDSVTKALYAMNKDGKPGFEEDEIRKQLIRFGGASLGAFYDKVIMAPGNLPIDEQLAKVGLKIEVGEESFADHGLGFFPSKAEKGLVVRTPRGAAAELKNDDVVVEIDGVSMEKDTNRAISEAAAEVLAKAEVGKAMKLKIRRNKEPMELTVTPVAGTRPSRKVVEIADASAGAKKLRAGWLATKKPAAA